MGQLRARSGAQHHRRPVRRYDELTLIIAHRGAWVQAPQNSLAALEAAIALGCDMVELDVRSTRDRRLVAIHDRRVGAAPVSGLTLAELRERVEPGQAPELEAMIELAAGRIGLDVELKLQDRVDAALAVLHRRLDPAQYVVTSFLESTLADVRTLAPQTRTGLLIKPGRRPRRLEERLKAAGISFVAPHASVARAGLLAWAAQRGLDTYLWTVNDRRAWRTLLADPRVTALITDRPAGALEARNALSRPPGS
ncbi:MAG: glycerophosphodiester phosphodiesterase [Solirubrobacteraceae bacterium]